MGKLTIIDNVTGKTLVLKGRKANETIRLRVLPGPRQNEVRLSEQQRMELTECLPDILEPSHLPESFVERIEDALLDLRSQADPGYRAYGDGTLYKQMVKQIKTAKSLEARELYGDAGKRLAAPLRRAIKSWTETASALNPRRPSHRPRDVGALGLGLHIAWALDDMGVELTTRREDSLWLVLQLARRWADELAGRRPLARNNMHRFVGAVLKRYPQWVEFERQHFVGNLYLKEYEFNPAFRTQSQKS